MKPSIHRLLLIVALCIYDIYAINAQSVSYQTELNSVLSKYDLNTSDIRITDDYVSPVTQARHIYYIQYYNGMDIINTESSLHIDKNSRKVKDNASLIHKSQLSVSGISSNSVYAALTLLNIHSIVENIKSIKPTEMASISFGDNSISFPFLKVSDLKMESFLYKRGKKLLPTFKITYEDLKSHTWKYGYVGPNNEVLEEGNLSIICNFGNSDHHDIDSEHNHSKTNIQKLAPKSMLMTIPNQSYRVLPMPIESPNHGSFAVVTTPWTLGGSASPYGWHDINGISGAEYNYTRGNNVYAYTDSIPNNQPDYHFDGGANLQFDVNFNPANSPAQNKSSAVVNLFYWTNTIHDLLYNYGFNEASGNFQTNNYGKGGIANDALNAEALDGSGTNNANMYTPSDGGTPRMQMYRWAYSFPNRDSDFDNGVIAHEYAHGLSNRLTGGPASSSCLNNSEQGGEGWSDFLGLWMTMKSTDLGTDKRGMATYLLSQPPSGAGLRQYAYTTDFAASNATYGLIKTMGSSVHRIGNVWALALWELNWAMINKYGFSSDLYNGNSGNNKALHLIIEGMRLQPCSPGFLDARDAILAADNLLYNGANQCIIWQAFAKRGMGFSAKQGTSSVGDEIEAFDLPPYCLQDVYVVKSGDYLNANSDTIVYHITIYNNSSNAITNVVIKDTLDTDVIYVNNSNGLSPLVNGNKLIFNLPNIAGKSVYMLEYKAKALDYMVVYQAVNDADDYNIPFTYQYIHGSNFGIWATSTSNPHNKAKSWAVSDLSSEFFNVLVSDPITLGADPLMSFWHSYNTETGWDGGGLEISTDNGATWAVVSNFVQNGYTGALGNSSNAMINGKLAFHGNSGGYIKSIANLLPWANQTVKFRFWFGTDDNTSGVGWYVDEIIIYKDAKTIVNKAGFTCAQNYDTAVSSSLMPKPMCENYTIVNNVIVKLCGEQLCNNGIDDDNDGKIDCSDSDCGKPVLVDIVETQSAQSYCPDISHGTISIIATGIDLQFSINNGLSYQNSNSFINLNPGNYNVVVKNTVSGCTATGLGFVPTPICPSEACMGVDAVIPTVTLQNYYYQNTIQSSARLKTPAELGTTTAQYLYQAGTSVQLTQGFEVPAGTEFEIKIKPCTN